LGPLPVLRRRRPGLLRLRLGEPAPRDGLPGGLPLPAPRSAAVPAAAAAGGGRVAPPLADLPDHARGGARQAPRRPLLAGPLVPLLPLRDAADPEPGEPPPPLHAALVPRARLPLEPLHRAGRAVLRVLAGAPASRGRPAHDPLPAHADREREPL